MLMINGDQHCIHRALLGSGWQEGTGSGCVVQEQHCSAGLCQHPSCAGWSKWDLGVVHAVVC